MKQTDQNPTQMQHARAPKPKPEARSAEELLRELQTHQLKLGIQNDALRVALTAFEESLERYVDLYDLSPVGYCTVSEHDLILQANLTAAALLGTDREALIRQPVACFIFKADQDIYCLLRKQLIVAGGQQDCELRMMKNGSTQFWAHLAATAAKGADGAQVIHIALSDITEHKHLEEALISVAEKRQCSIGQELHDSLGQQLAAISYQSRALEKKLLASGDAGSAGVAALIAAQSQNAVMQCKQLAQGLLPIDLETNGLTAALQTFASRIAIAYGIACDFVCPNEVAVDADLELNLYRIAQEAVNNAIRHGGACRLTISLATNERGLSLSICDDGCGFGDADIKHIATPGMGIKIMRYRAAQLGATLEFLPHAAGGTEVRVEMRAG